MLTKSDFLKFLQCPKYLWLHKYRKDLTSKEVDKITQFRFDQWNKIELYAQNLFPKWYLVDWDFKDLISKTKSAIERKTEVIYQATAVANNLMSKADIIVLNQETWSYDIYEVKSCTEVKDIHLSDVTFQKICFESAWYKIWKTYLIFVNSQYVKDWEINAKEFLTIEDVTSQVSDNEQEISLQIDNAKKILARKDEFNVKIVKQCSKPYECPFKEYCWKDIPACSIYKLNWIREDRIKELLDRDCLLIKDIPDDISFSENKQLVVDCIKHDEEYIDKDSINNYLDELKYPLYYLDYETINPWIPVYDWTRPYQQTTFQYSLHIQTAPDANIDHYEYLGTWEDNPMPWLIESMKENIWSTWSVIVWNKWFECARNSEMAKIYPQHSTFLEDVNSRIFDLMIPFSKCWYVIPEVMWSYSIKPILPVLVPELSYKDLAISGWSDASNIWLMWVVDGWGHNSEGKTYWDLLAYCELDTLAMVEIMKKIKDKIIF